MKLFGKIGSMVDGIVGGVIMKTGTVTKAMYEASPKDTVKVIGAGMKGAKAAISTLAVNTKKAVAAKLTKSSEKKEAPENLDNSNNSSEEKEVA